LKQPRSYFFRGTVIPICAGWFGEVNKDYESLITKLAREAAAGDDCMRISPLVYLDRKGGAYQIMLQQFRRDHNGHAGWYNFHTPN
jgi:hypothetical protein